VQALLLSFDPFVEFHGFQVCITKLKLDKARRDMLDRKAKGRAQMTLKKEKGVVAE